MFVARIEGRTIREALIVLLEVGLCALTPRADGHGVVFVRVARGRELVQVWAGLVAADDQEADSVWTATVLLCVDLGL